MHSLSALIPSIPSRPSMRPMFAVCVAAFLGGSSALAQSEATPALRLEGGVTPGGVRTSATSRWGAFNFQLTNLGDRDREARVFIYYKDAPEVQYGRNVWVPANSRLSSWMLAGPAPVEATGQTRDLGMVIEDRTEGKNQPLLPRTEERLRSHSVVYRKREPYTAILLDDDLPEGVIFGQLPQPDSPNEEAARLARAFRHARNLSQMVQRVDPGPMPPTVEAFDGIDHFVLASERIAHDAAGMAALRHWLQQGGKVWVMLDLVRPDVLGPLLGDSLDFEVVDRVGLTRYRIETHPAGKGVGEPPLQRHEESVAFVRVQLPPGEQVRQTIDGWPVWFTRRVGRGEVFFTALGPRGWYRPRKASDHPSPYQDFPYFPVPMTHLEDLGVALHPASQGTPFQVDSLQPLLTQEIGYSVVRRETVVMIFGVALAAAVVAGLLLRKAKRRELLGWLGPLAALGATAMFFVVGERARRAVPPTVAAAQIVEAVSGKEEVAVHGLMEVYRPRTGPIEAGVERGGMFALDGRDMQDQVRQFVYTDLDAWHWERFALLAEPRLAPFHVTLPTEKPIVAQTHFGAEGIEGRLFGPFHHLSDALLSTPNGRQMAVHIEPDGAFRAARSDALAKGQYLAGAVLTDRQQRRQELYRAFLKAPGPDSLRGRNVLLAWCDPLEMHFHLAPEARSAGSALVVAPLRLERSEAGKRITIPAAFLPYQRILDGIPTRPTMEAGEGIEMQLRFQLPGEVLPFKVERVRLTAKIAAPGRRVVVSGREGDRASEVQQVENPLDAFSVEIGEEKLLHLDAEGGWSVNLRIGEPRQVTAPAQPLPPPSPRGGNRGRPPANRPPPAKMGNWEEKWSIDYLELEVIGHSEG